MSDCQELEASASLSPTGLQFLSAAAVNLSMNPAVSSLAPGRVFWGSSFQHLHVRLGAGHLRRREGNSSLSSGRMELRALGCSDLQGRMMSATNACDYLFQVYDMLCGKAIWQFIPGPVLWGPHALLSIPRPGWPPVLL